MIRYMHPFTVTFLNILSGIMLPAMVCGQSTPPTIEPSFQSYLAHMAAASASLRLHETSEAKRWLDQAPWSHETWEWRMLRHACDTSVRQTTASNWFPVRIDYSSDGMSMAIAGDDGVVRILESDDLSIKNQIQVSDQAVYAARFSPDNASLVTCSRDGRIALWSVEDGQKKWEQESGGQGLADVAFHPGGKRIAFCSWFRNENGVVGLVSMWNVDAGEQLWTAEFGVKPIVVVKFSPDGSRLAVGTWDALVGIWDSEKPEAPQELNFRDVASYSAIDDIGFSPDGRRIVAASKNGSPRIWNLESGQIEGDMHGHANAVFCVAFLPDGKGIVSGGSDGVVGLWDTASRSLIHRFMGHDNRIRCLALRPGGEELISGSADGTLRVWNLKNTGHLDSPQSSQYSYGGTVSPDGMFFASGGQSPADVTIWDTESRQPLRTFAGLTGSINYLDFGPDNLLVGGNWAGDVVLWDADKGVEAKRLEKQEQGGMHQCALSPDGRWVAASTSHHRIAIWAVNSGKLIHQLPLDSVAWGIDFSPNSQHLAFGVSDGTVRILNAETWQEFLSLKVGKSQLNSVKFSPLGDLIACGGEDGRLSVWDLSLQQERWSALGHSQRIWSVEFLGDGNRLASGGADQKLRLWDVESGQSVVTLADFASDIYNLATCPNSDSLFVNATRLQLVLDAPTALPTED
jgi:WD40 repeat protein